MTAENKLRRRWFSCSLRELLFLTAIAGLATGWGLDHLRLVNSDAMRVGMEVTEDVRMMHAGEAVGPLDVEFLPPFVKRSFLARLSVPGLPPETPW
jgi:hypothetical protein